MANINLLDCTVQESEKIVHWHFKKEDTQDLLENMTETAVDILEIGTLTGNIYKKKTTVFTSMQQATKLIGKKSDNVMYSLLTDILEPISNVNLEAASKDNADMIRVIVRKSKIDTLGVEVDLLQQSFEYCREIAAKGYRLCVLFNETDQYSDEEFMNLLAQFEQLDPFAIYIVDSWGIQSTDSTLHYLHLAAQNLKSGIRIGYRGYNNKMQVLTTAQAIIQDELQRDLLLDASIYGIGQHAGLLHTELIAPYMNVHCAKNYQLDAVVNVYENHIKHIYQQAPWGYSMPYLLTAQYNCNPQYGFHYAKKLYLSDVQTEQILSSLTNDEKKHYSTKTAQDAANRILAKKTALIVLTNDDWGEIESLLANCSWDLLHTRSTMFICNYGKTETSKTAVLNFMFQDKSDIRYIRIPEEVHINDAIFKLLEECVESYTYFWIFNSFTIPDLSIMEKILTKAENADYILLTNNEEPENDVAVAPEKDEALHKMQGQDRKLPVLFTPEFYCANREFVLLNSRVIYTKAVIADLIRDKAALDPFVFQKAIAKDIVQHKRMVLLCSKQIMRQEDRGFNCMLTKQENIILTWSVIWYEFIQSLPTAFDEKTRRMANMDGTRMNIALLYNFVYFRSIGKYGPQEFQQIKHALPWLTHKSVKRFKMIAYSPKWCLKWLIHNENKSFVKNLRSFYSRFLAKK